MASGFTSEFLGETIPFEETEDIADAVGELSNMIAGDVKSKLSDQGIKTQISLPNVICGTNLSVLSNRDHPAIVTRFSSSWGDFWVEVVAGVTEGETRAAGS